MQSIVPPTKTFVAPRPAQDPSPWTVIHEYSKTIVTLGTGLFGVCIAFFNQIAGASPDKWLMSVQFLFGLCLASAIICALVAAGRLSGYLRLARGPIACQRWANWSFVFMIASFIFLFLSLWFMVWDRSSGLEAALAEARKSLEAALGKSTDLELALIEANQTTSAYHFVYDERTSGKVYHVLVRGSTMVISPDPHSNVLQPTPSPSAGESIMTSPSLLPSTAPAAAVSPSAASSRSSASTGPPATARPSP